VPNTKQGRDRLVIEAQREVVRRYLISHHGEQIAEFVEVESGKRNNRPQLVAAMALAKRRRSVAFIATLMDSV
jgi:hypothetical protein